MGIAVLPGPPKDPFHCEDAMNPILFTFSVKLVLAHPVFEAEVADHLEAIILEKFTGKFELYAPLAEEAKRWPFNMHNPSVQVA
jgi:hypothetical protein